MTLGLGHPEGGLVGKNASAFFASREASDRASRELTLEIDSQGWGHATTQLKKNDGTLVHCSLRVERARVRLAVVDVVVVDEDERSVSGLSIDDFEVVIGNETRRPDTLDVSCQGGGAPEPKAVRRIEDRAPALRDASPKRIALVIDYLHLSGQHSWTPSSR